jgi:hypothetical protein
LNPLHPALDQLTTFPLRSVIVTMVLLNVAWIHATPTGTFFFTFFFLVAPRASAKVLLLENCCQETQQRFNVGTLRLLPHHTKTLLLLTCRLLSCDCSTTRSLSRPGVRACALSTSWKTATVPKTTVRRDVHQTLDRHLNFSTEISLYLLAVLNNPSNPRDLVLGEAIGSCIEVYSRLSKDLLRLKEADPINIRETADDSFVSG